MDLFLPPYIKTKKFILGSAALTLTLYLSVLLLMGGFSHQTLPSDRPASTVSGDQLKKDFKTEVAKVQSDGEVGAWLRDGFVILDIRSSEDFNKQHIRGAINAPITYLDKSTLNPDVDMIVYSDNQRDLGQARTILAEKQIRNVYLLHDTLGHLKTAGYELSGTETK